MVRGGASSRSIARRRPSNIEINWRSRTKELASLVINDQRGSNQRLGADAGEPDGETGVTLDEKERASHDQSGEAVTGNLTTTGAAPRSMPRQLVLGWRALVLTRRTPATMCW